MVKCDDAIGRVPMVMENHGKQSHHGKSWKIYRKLLLYKSRGHQ